MNKDDTLIEMVRSMLQGYGQMLERHDSVLMAMPDRIDKKIDASFRAHRRECPAYKNFDALDKRTDEITGVVNLQEERIRAAQEAAKKAPWWAPTLVKVLAGLGLGGLTVAVGSSGIQCSTSKASEVDTSRAKPPAAVADSQDQ